MISLIYALMGFVLSLFSYRLFLYLLNTKFDAKYTSKAITPITILVFALTDIFLGLIFYGISPLISNGILIIVYALILFTYVRLFRMGATTHMLFWVCICLAFWGIVHTIAGVYRLLVFPAIPDALLPEWASLQISSIIVLVQAVGTYMLSRKKNAHIKMSPSVMLILIIIPILSCLLLAFLSGYPYSVSENSTTLSTVLFYTSLVIALINLAVFILYERMTSLTEQTLQQQTLLQKAQLEQIHHDELQSVYRETRVWRHDYRNHLQAIQGLVETQSYTALATYLQEIDGSLEKIAFRVNSGNELLDAIINTKISIAEKNDIQFNTDIEIVVNDVMSFIDITILVGNLLDNAIEACLRIDAPDRNKVVSLRIVNLPAELILSVENTTQGIVKSKNQVFATSKLSGDHGIGMQQIDSIVHKYNGYISRESKQNSFQTIVRLPLQKAQSKAAI